MIWLVSKKSQVMWFLKIQCIWIIKTPFFICRNVTALHGKNIVEMLYFRNDNISRILVWFYHMNLISCWYDEPACRVIESDKINLVIKLKKCSFCFSWYLIYTDYFSLLAWYENFVIMLVPYNLQRFIS